MAGDNELLKEVDAALDDSDSNVLLAYRVSKSQASHTVLGRRGKLQSKPRILAVSAKRSAQVQQRFNIRVHVLKTGPGGSLQVANVYKLGTLATVEAVSSDASGKTFLLTFDNKPHSQQPLWTTRTIDDRNQMLVTLMQLSREHYARMPKVVGIDVVEMALWAQKNVKPVLLGGPPAPAAAEKGEAAEAGGRELPREPGDPAASYAEQQAMAAETAAAAVMQQDLVSKAEEEDMEALLGSYVIGLDEAEAFSERLKRELGALEAANVHAILESEGLVEEVLARLDGAAGIVDDMDEWLSVFNAKLRHMRDDIQVIESRNNRLEVQVVNDEALLGEVERLLGRLRVPQDYAFVLTDGAFDDAQMAHTLEASQWLVDALQAFDAAVLGASYAQIRAVRDSRGELELLKATFVQRGVDFLRTFIAEIVDNFGRNEVTRHPDHGELRRQCMVYSRLVQHVKVLDFASIMAVRKTYIRHVNALLRRETREFANQLKTNTRVEARSTAVWELEYEEPSNTGDTTPVYDAYVSMLRTFQPLLTDEAEFITDFLDYDVPPVTGGGGDAVEHHPEKQSHGETRTLVAALDELFDGIEEDFMGVVDWAARLDPLRCIPMLTFTDQWLDVQSRDPSSYARHSQLLANLMARLKQQFFKFVEDENAQIEKFNRGIKQTGVLPFIPRFAELAQSMESMVQGGSRELVDHAYNKLVTTIFSVLDKIAQLDPKHSDVLLLENYAAFQNSTYELAGSQPTLRAYYQQASEAYEVACLRYIDTVIMEHFERLFEFGAKIKNLLSTIETEEIQFQAGFSKADMRKLVKSSLSGAERALQVMSQRMRKQLSSGDLLPSLWAKCQDEFVERYEDLEGLIAQCYPNEVLSPSAGEVAEMFRQVDM